MIQVFKVFRAMRNERERSWLANQTFDRHIESRRADLILYDDCEGIVIINYFADKEGQSKGKAVLVGCSQRRPQMQQI